MKKMVAIFMGMVLAVTAAGQAFRFPDIPQELKSPQERAAYLAAHLWDHFDFTADPQPGSTDVIEQAFVDFLSVLSISGKRQKPMDAFIMKAAQNPALLRSFMDMAEKYLYEPMSPMRDDRMYMEFLRTVVRSRHVPGAEKEQPLWQLARLNMNAVGKKAQDFEYMDGGAVRSLSETKGEYIVIFFHDPECRDCKRMRAELDASEKINSMAEAGRLKIVGVSIENEDRMLYYSRLYDLRTFPVLYLLDARKRVLLKNVEVVDIENEL